MTTISAATKNGRVAVAADTLTKWGSSKESAAYVANNSKLITVGTSVIAISGPTSAKLVLQHYFSKASDYCLDTVEDIFRTWLTLHEALRDHYFLNVADEETAFESTQLEVLIANATGIYGVSPHRAVQQFTRFYAYGRGHEYAMGAMYARYGDDTLSAEDIARLGVEAAAEFEDGTGLPVEAKSIELDSTG